MFFYFSVHITISGIKYGSKEQIIFLIWKCFLLFLFKWSSKGYYLEKISSHSQKIAFTLQRKT
ncbi:hypothetical protein HMPREF3034_01717 [Prevotella sp. DNF00663]|nr:hypothetical protein HMPREF3034_01717 [Prevotella sp. DNF00663]